MHGFPRREAPNFRGRKYLKEEHKKAIQEKDAAISALQSKIETYQKVTSQLTNVNQELDNSTKQAAQSNKCAEEKLKERISQLEADLKAANEKHLQDLATQKTELGDTAAAERKQAEDSQARLVADVAKLASHEKELEKNLSEANSRIEEYEAFFEVLNCTDGSGDDSSAQKIPLRTLRQFHSHITKIKIDLATVRREVAEFRVTPQKVISEAKAVVTNWAKRIQETFLGKLNAVLNEKDTRAEKLGEELGQARVDGERLEKSLVREQGKVLDIRRSMSELEAEGVKKANIIFKTLGIKAMKAAE